MLHNRPVSICNCYCLKFEQCSAVTLFTARKHKKYTIMDDSDLLDSLSITDSSFSTNLSNAESISYVRRSDQYYLSLLVNLDNIHIHDNITTNASKTDNIVPIINNTIIDDSFDASNLDTSLYNSSNIDAIKKLIQTNNIIKQSNKYDRIGKDARFLQKHLQRIDNHTQAIIVNASHRKRSPRRVMLDSIPRDDLTRNER